MVGKRKAGYLLEVEGALPFFVAGHSDRGRLRINWLEQPKSADGSAGRGGHCCINLLREFFGDDGSGARGHGLGLERIAEQCQLY